MMFLSSNHPSSPMLAQNQFSCFLIGEGTLPIQCAELLLKRGHQVLGIVSPDVTISNWAKEKGISHISPKDDLLTFFSQQPFDYLFSIVNRAVLPKEILKLPRQGAINYHDAPLPRYAGANATSWALMQQEKTHGVTWHRMSEIIDGGDILKQVSLDIAEDETAFTLNGQCYEAAIHSFAQLIDELSSGQAVATPQNLNERTYFPPARRLRAGGLLDFNRCAYELDALVRALDFGPYPNPLGLAKLAIGGHFMVVSRLKVLDEISQASPGTITGIEPDFLKVSTSSYEVALGQLQTLEGEALSIPNVVEKFDLQVSYRFQDIEPEVAKRIEKFERLIAKHEAFWIERLASLQPITIPYAGRTASPWQQKRLKSVKMPVPDEVRSFLEECHPGWNSGDFILAAFVGYLTRIGGTNNFTLGLRDVELAREIDENNSIFAAYIPCHLKVNLEQSFEKFLAAVRKQVAFAKQHKTYGRDAIVRYPALREVRKQGSTDLFPVVIERVEKIDGCQACPGHELTFIISEDGKECGWFYNAEALDSNNIARMIEQFTIFLQGIVTDSSQHLACQPLLSEEDRHKILVEWNDTAANYPQDKCIHQLFEEQVERTPSHVAVVFEDQRLTYRELNARANQLAHYLQKLGVKPEVMVGICVERSLDTIVGILGILKAGGAYVPIAPDYPSERVNFMLNDAQISVLITQEKILKKVSLEAEKIVCLDRECQQIKQEKIEPVKSEVNSQNLAYVIYTSGSTGTPKGVMIEHSSVINILWYRIHQQLMPQDLKAFPFTSSLAFDVSIIQIFPPLLVGGKIIIVKDLAHFASLIEREEITFFSTLPSIIDRYIEDYKLPDNLEAIGLGGEKLTKKLLKKLSNLSQIKRITNSYGPTETTVGSCANFVLYRP